jgi:hypothetical protein
MTAALLIQYLVIAVATLVSAWVVANKQFPNATRRLRTSLALPLVREGRPEWLRAWGRRIAPAPSGGVAACGGCSSCGPPTPVTRKR